MRKLLLAALAAASMSMMVDRAQAMPVTAPGAMKPAVDRINPIDKVRYCEFYDPAIGDYVVFWVNGPCYALGAPGYDVWLRRWYYGGRYWRGRLGARPWVGRPAIVYRGGPRRGVVVGPRGGVRVSGPRGTVRVGPRGGVRVAPPAVGRPAVRGGRVGGGGRAGGGGRGRR
jgi:hypothetical protein